MSVSDIEDSVAAGELNAAQVFTQMRQLAKREFNQGVIWSAARINELHDQPVIACDVLKEANLSNHDYKQAPEYDLRFIRKESCKDIPKGIE